MCVCECLFSLYTLNLERLHLLPVDIAQFANLSYWRIQNDSILKWVDKPDSEFNSSEWVQAKWGFQADAEQVERGSANPKTR